MNNDPGDPGNLDEFVSPPLCLCVRVRNESLIPLLVNEVISPSSATAQVVLARRAGDLATHNDELLLFGLDSAAANEVHSKARYEIPANGGEVSDGKRRRNLTNAKFW